MLKYIKLQEKQRIPLSPIAVVMTALLFFHLLCNNLVLRH